MILLFLQFKNYAGQNQNSHEKYNYKGVIITGNWKYAGNKSNHKTIVPNRYFREK